MTQKRRISDLLPEVLQTDVLRKFLAITGDHLFQPGHVEHVNGYMGTVPAYARSSDVYVQEPDDVRQAYQVAATLVSKNNLTGETDHVLFYQDLINKLRFQGALVDDHNRLFAAEYYSWQAPFDLDKWLNFINYVWLPEGPDLITLNDITDVQQIQTQSTYTYTGEWSRAGSAEIHGTPLTFSTGQKIRFAADVNPQVRDLEFIVEQVGRKIQLVPDDYLSTLAWESPTEWDSTVWDTSSLSVTPTYVTMGRGSQNGNPWSVGNRWFHRSVALQSGMDPAIVEQSRAQRPILEMHAHIRMWDTGTQSRGYVNLVDTCTTNLSQIEGKTHHLVFENCDQTGAGVALEDNMTVLFTNLRDPNNPLALDANLNNRIYRVSNLRSGGTIVLNVVPRFTDRSGVAQEGDCVFVLQGDVSKPDITQSNINSSWYYTQGAWKKGQSRQTAATNDPTPEQLKVWNQAPLFDVFDTRGNSLSDPGVYPNSIFKGSTLVQYAVKSVGVPDKYLGFIPDYADVSPTNFLFQITLHTDEVQYVQDSRLLSIQGMRFYQIQNPDGDSEYANFWTSCKQLSRQYVVNQYWGTGDQTEFEIDQQPDLSAPGAPAIQVQVQDRTLALFTDYQIHDNKVVLNQAPASDVRVQIRTWAGDHNTTQSGHFELPRNLVCNAQNQELDTFSRSDLIRHVISIMENQTGFKGQAVGENNWRDSARDQSLGTEILQHRGSMLKLMALNAPALNTVFETSNTPVDPSVTVNWAQQEYVRFYNKLIRSLVNLFNTQQFTGAQPADAWLTAALRQINVGKTVQNSWSHSGIEHVAGTYCDQLSDNPTWVPTSATRLGATPVWRPEVFLDFSQPGAPLSMRCHNGAIVVLKDLQGNALGDIQTGNRTNQIEDLSHPVARAWFLFETRMYESMPATYVNPDRPMPLDARTLFSAKYRRTSYSRSDQIRLQAPAFEKWSTFNQVDVFRNNTFDLNNPWTWNYSSCVDLDGEPVPGHWRGIYFHFYDTDQPDLSPWHMLGFSQKPLWWDSEYGAAPYTSGNLKMWRDIRDGRIPQGDRAGVHAEYARPGILKCVPVDASGKLLSPNLTGMLQNLPSVTQAGADWKLGDRSPMENVWLTTVESDFTWAHLMYLTRPTQFIEYLWDGVKQVQVFGDQTHSQWIHAQTDARLLPSQHVMHRESPSEVFADDQLPDSINSCGIQYWFTEKLQHENLNVTRYLGSVIRGSACELGHKVGGFINSDSLRVTVDSFGLGNQNSLLLPQEDVRVELTRTPSVKEIFYSGVIVEFKGSQQGWRLIGYDSVDPYLTILPANTRGPKQTVVVGNQRVMEYTQGVNQPTRIAYGTLFRTRQEVYDVLVGVGRYQAQQGFVFDQFDPAASRMRDWSQSAREFLFWSQGPWAPGTYIQLSPLASHVKFKTNFGIVQSVGQLVNGAHAVLDKAGNVIPLKDLDMLRIDDEIAIKPLNDQGVFGVRLFVTSMEHVIMFNNRTIFGDLIYDPVLNQRQERFRVLAYRSTNWQGRLDAPGYMVTQSLQVLGDDVIINNRIIPNFEKSVQDIRLMFESDMSTQYQIVGSEENQVSTITQSVDDRLNKMATHLVGYQERKYLTELLINRTAAFQFYQGMIQQKGTPETVQRLLRNTQVLSLDQQLEVFEEFAFRSAMYGAKPQNHQLDMLLIEDQVTSDPQQIKFTGINNQDDLRDQVITIIPRDARKVNQTQTLPEFLGRTHYGAAPGDLPTAGYVLLTEVTHVVLDDQELSSLYERQEQLSFENSQVQLVRPGQSVWQLMHATLGWCVYKVVAPIWRVTSTQPSTQDSFLTTVNTSAPHNLQIGDKIILFGVQNTNTNIDGTFGVLNVTRTSFDIEITTQIPGTRGTIWLYVPVRFSSFEQMRVTDSRGLLSLRDLVYVDGDAQNPWVVYRKGSTRWFPHRTESLRPDNQLLLGARLYDAHTLQTKTLLTLWNPIQNQIPGIITSQIDYVTPYDPAQYTQDPEGLTGTNTRAAWGDAQVGKVWWDLNTTRFLDYEIGPNSYRRQHWGSIAPGTTIDIYEWVRSPVPPASWANFVSQNGRISSPSGASKATGEVRDPLAPHVQASLLTEVGVLQTVYYFWVKNQTQVPALTGRTLSTSQLSDYIQNPQNSGIRWWAAQDHSHVLVGGAGSELNADRTVLQITYTHSREQVPSHTQHELIRPGDPLSDPTVAVWHKLRDSLLEFTAQGDSVPNLRLAPAQRLGMETTPSQSWFVRADQARTAFVTSINQLINEQDVPVSLDTTRLGWQSLFTSTEPVPEPNNLLHSVACASVMSVTYTHELDDLITDTIELTHTAAHARIQENWVFQAQSVTHAVRVKQVTIVNNMIQIQLQTTVTLLQEAEYVFREFESYYVTQNSAHELWVSLYTDPEDPSEPQVIVDGVSVQKNHRVLFKNQPHAAQNGIYSLIRTHDLTEVAASGLHAYALFVRSDDLRDVNQDWYLAQTRVEQGVSQSQTVWHQSNQNVLELGVSDVIWQQGQAVPLYARRVKDLAARNALAFQIPFGQRVLVDANPETQNKWSLWTWSRESEGSGDWKLYRIQGYSTQDVWSQMDWWAPGYSPLDVITETFASLRDLEQSVGLKTNSLVKVNNTGAGTWGVYERTSNDSWKLVGSQLGQLQLSDRLYDYEKHQMGFAGGGFDTEGQGYEYDTRLELNQIYQALWDPLTKAGFLKQDAQINEVNTLLFVMVNHVFVEQKFVDWVFKTSFINMRGFSDNLTPSLFYTQSVRESLVSYVNEVKPYHVKIREFKDTRRALSVGEVQVSDFDKPPFDDFKGSQGIRILSPNNVRDEQILSTDPVYVPWKLNHVTNPELIRQLKVKLLFDRVACVPEITYEPGYDENSVINQTVNDMHMLRALGGSDLIVPGDLVKVNQDGFGTWSWYVRTLMPYDALMPDLMWHRVAYENNQGAVNRIHSHYAPRPGQLSIEDPRLIPGCLGDLTTLEGGEFNTEDAWDQSVWDNLRGWSHTDAGDLTEMKISGGVAPQYVTLNGTGTDRVFSLNLAPQDPQSLSIWVSGVQLQYNLDWFLKNHVDQVLVSDGGLGYSVNDVLVLQGGVTQSPAQVKVTQVSPVGTIMKVTLLNPGVYDQTTDNPAQVQGGSGINATMWIRWGGKQIEFVNPPPRAKKGPNIWVVESGSTFNPAVSSVLDVIMDGAGLNRPHHAPGHPEELLPVRLRNSMILDVYTAATPGPGGILTHTYESNGITDQFDIGQVIWSVDQLWVYVNGEIQQHAQDYVVNLQFMRVVFLQAPVPGTVSVISVSPGGASRSMGVYEILAAGMGYDVGDVITMQGGVPLLNNAVVQVTAVSAQQAQVISGGSGYQPGDILFYRYGVSSQTLSVQVTVTTAQGNVRGIIQEVIIMTPGIYTSVLSGVNDWYTTGLGSGAQFDITWGVSQVLPVNRGIYSNMPEILTQSSLTPGPGSPGGGQGLALRVLPGVVIETVKFVADGVNNEIRLSKRVNENTVLVTLNGVRTFDFNLDSEDPSRLGMNQTPVLGDVIIVVLFNSSLFSMKSQETWQIENSEFTRTLLNPPLFAPVQTRNTQVFSNSLKLRPPEFYMITSDGASSILLPFTPTSVNDLTVWWDNLLLPANAYQLSGATLMFSTPPLPGVVINVQYADVATENHDYVVVGDVITLRPWAVSTGDQIMLVVFTEDSSQTWTSDTWPGDASGVFTLTEVPDNLGSVQVFVDGEFIHNQWDYQLQQFQNQIQIVLGTQFNLSAANTVQAFYQVSESSLPPVAFRQFQNIYAETEYLRLSDMHMTRLIAPVNVDSDHVWVSDARNLAPASDSQPGAVWIQAERLEYKGIQPAPTAAHAHAARLIQLRRGTLGTPSGEIISYEQVFHSGDGAQSLFEIPWSLTSQSVVVTIAGVQQVQGDSQDPRANYTIVQNPPSKVAGTYVQFWPERLINDVHVPSSIPVAGDRIVQITQRKSAPGLCHAVNTIVRDASANQRIPGGAVWPQGDQGIQRSKEPQHVFLNQSPGVRRV
jgi:hypothetical protein